MTRLHLHRSSRIVVTVLPLVALLSVLSGFGHPPEPDEGAGAHVFQLSVVALVPALALFLATGDSTRPRGDARALALPAVVLALAFATLYVLEHRG